MRYRQPAYPLQMPAHAGAPLPAVPTLIDPKPLTDLKQLAKFPQAARRREIVKIVDKFSGNGVHLFTHYTAPVLDARRRARLASGATRKQYPKSTSQLWTTLNDEQKIFWDHQVKLIRLGIANGSLGHEQCVEDAGFQSEWRECMRFAEHAVAEYLEVSVPAFVEEMENERSDNSTTIGTDGTFLKPDVNTNSIKADGVIRIEYAPSEHSHEVSAVTCLQLLDTLREPFTVEPRMVYGNFAQLFPYDTIRSAEGKRQAAMLRQLADILDRYGRELFYYYATPHLWKAIRPTDVDETIASVAHRMWMFMPGHMKKQWEMESARTKKLLGDGSIEGLDRLQLDQDCEEGWKLHDMTEEAMKVHDVKKASEVTSDTEE